MSIPLLITLDFDTTVAEFTDLFPHSTFLQVIPLLLLVFLFGKSVEYLIYLIYKFELDERVAADVGTTPERLSDLATHKATAVRVAVAHNPNTPPDTLLHLADDRSEDVRLVIADRVKEVVCEWGDEEIDTPAQRCATCAQVTCGDGDGPSDCWRVRVAA